MQLVAGEHPLGALEECGDRFRDPEGLETWQGPAGRLAGLQHLRGRTRHRKTLSICFVCTVVAQLQ